MSVTRAHKYMHIHIAVEIGFKDVSYSVSEDYRGFSFEVEVKNDRQFAVPILFTLTDMEGEALSESVWLHGL